MQHWYPFSDPVLLYYFPYISTPSFEWYEMKIKIKSLLKRRTYWMYA